MVLFFPVGIPFLICFCLSAPITPVSAKLSHFDGAQAGIDQYVHDAVCELVNGDLGELLLFESLHIGQRAEIEDVIFEVVLVDFVLRELVR